MGRFLRDPLWQGVAALIGIAAIFFASGLCLLWKITGTITACLLVMGFALLVRPLTRYRTQRKLSSLLSMFRKVWSDARKYWVAVLLLILGLTFLGLFESYFVADQWVVLVTVVWNLLIVAVALWSFGRSPRFVRVVVIDPDHKRYEAEIEPDADDETIRVGLIKKIGLPPVDKDGKPIKYYIDTSGARNSISRGGTILIRRKQVGS